MWIVSSVLLSLASIFSYNFKTLMMYIINFYKHAFMCIINYYASLIMYRSTDGACVIPFLDGFLYDYTVSYCYRSFVFSICYTEAQH
jgi:hypothetical protein